MFQNQPPDSTGPPLSKAIAAICREAAARATAPTRGTPGRVLALADALRFGPLALGSRDQRVVSRECWRRALREAILEGAGWQALSLAEKLDWLDAVDAVVGPARTGAPGAGLSLPHHDLMRRLLSEPAALGALLEEVPIAVWVYDSQGRPITMNSQAVRVIGGTIEEAHGVLIQQDPAPGVDLFRPDGTPYAYDEYPIVRALRGESVRDEEVVVRSAWRSGIYLVNTTPLRDEQGRIVGTVSTTQDIGELKRLEFELERERRAALEASLAKSRTLRALSHDLRQPLNAIALASDLLLTQVREPEDLDMRDAGGQIRRSIRTVTDLLNDSLRLSRIESGVVPLQVSRFALDEFLAECLASFEGDARDKGLTILYEGRGLEGVEVSTDRVKLKQILSNLISNSIRYTQRGEVVLRAEAGPEEVKVAVSDTGVGIALEDQERIFEEYIRLPSATKRVREGSGLGLAIARGLSILLEGRLELVSKPGVGSTFTLTLPVRIVDGRRDLASKGEGREQPGQEGGDRGEQGDAVGA